MPNSFPVDYYKDGYRLLATSDGTKILVIPEGKKAPKDLEKGIIVMQQPGPKSLFSIILCHGYF